MRWVFMVLMAGCGVDLGASDCEREAQAVEAASARCGGHYSGHDCGGVIASSTSDIDACVAWFETASCDELAANKYYADKCHIKLLVSPF